MKTGSELIKEERERQIEKEGHTNENDDSYTNHELLYASLAYVESSIFFQKNNQSTDSKVEDLYMFGILSWPGNWSRRWFKPKDPLTDLVKSGALIAAEIDRLQRIKEKMMKEDSV